MGTSTARRTPGIRVWRMAKVTATRYLSPAAGQPVTARELVSRYITALKEGTESEGGALAAFRLTRKVGQQLGAFCQHSRKEGLPAALSAWGVSAAPLPESQALAHGLATLWLDETGSLEEAALRPALVGSLLEWFRTVKDDPGPAKTEAFRIVKSFLAAALCHRLVFDLGEPLEAVAPGWRPLAAALAGIQQEITQAVDAAAEAASSPANWQGLEGWVWVTRVLEETMAYFLRP